MNSILCEHIPYNYVSLLFLHNNKLHIATHNSAIIPVPTVPSMAIIPAL